MQRYLNSQGASLTVDGSWGPKTEAAYQAVFGQPSGRQTSYGYPRYSPPDNTLTENNLSAFGKYSSLDFQEAAAAGMTKKQIEQQVEDNGGDPSNSLVQEMIRWALSK